MSSSVTRLYRKRVPRLTSDNFTCCHTRDREGRPWLLSQPVRLYWHSTNLSGTGGHSWNRTHDLLTRSRTLYWLSYPPPPPPIHWLKISSCSVDISWEWRKLNYLLESSEFEFKKKFQHICSPLISVLPSPLHSKLTSMEHWLLIQKYSPRIFCYFSCL